MQADDVDKQMATAIFLVEKELGTYIDDNYPLMKFFSQLEELMEYKKRQLDEAERSRSGGSKAKTFG